MITRSGRPAWLARGLTGWGRLTRALDSLQPAAALQQHLFWGALLAGLAIYGLGPWSPDRWTGPAYQLTSRSGVEPMR